MDAHLELLRREFDAREGTFLLGLRGEGLKWDTAARDTRRTSAQIRS